MPVTIAQPSPLFDTQDGLSPFLPLPLAPYHYVPILQDRSGERDALTHVKPETWARLTPLIVIVGSRDARPPTPTMLAGRARNVSEALGDHPFFVDTLRLRPDIRVPAKRNVSVLEYLYDRLRWRDAQFIPVLPLNGSRTHRQLVGDAAAEDGRGAALRVDLARGIFRSRNELVATVRARTDELGLPASEVDVLVDLGFLAPDARVDVDWIIGRIAASCDAANWRNVVLFGTSMPQSLGMINEGSLGALPRHEWHVWEQAVAQLGPVVNYGDYAVQHPKPPEDTGPGMRANIRYTMPNRTVIVRGEGPVTQGLGSLQYQGLALQLVGLDDFTTRDFSWGDAIIEECADGHLPRSSQHTWRGAGTSHHIQLVCDQLAARASV